jgi:hypothetical protein
MLSPPAPAREPAGLVTALDANVAFSVSAQQLLHRIELYFSELGALLLIVERVTQPPHISKDLVL